MTLSEKIMSLRKQAGYSQEELAEKINVSRQAVSKWESGVSTPDLDKIVKISEHFNVSIDYLLKDKPEDIDSGVAISIAENEEVRSISMEYADEFIGAAKNTADKIAFGVLLCIMSPILLIFLGGFAEFGKISISEEIAGIIGVSLLLIMVATAVGIFISNSMKMKKYEFLENEAISLQYGVEANVLRQKEAYEEVFRMHIIFGVVLCILAVVPLIAVAAFDNEPLAVIGVCVLLFLVAIGVFAIVRASIVYSSFQKLLQEEDYTKENKMAEKSLKTLYGAYWLLATALYLALSFITENWDRTWIVWPVAGVLFAVVSAVAKSIVINKNK